MWLDARGSEVLTLAECRRLLAVGVQQHRHGHLGIPTDGAPLVLPTDYCVVGHDVVVRVGEELFGKLDGRLVAFEVDGLTDLHDLWAPEGTRWWSVLLRGLAKEAPVQELSVAPACLPVPRVAEAGERYVRIRGDVVTGRRLGRDASGLEPAL